MRISVTGKKLLLYVFIIQLTLLLTYLIAFFGFRTPILDVTRIFIGMIYLMFLPGILILTILKIRDLSFTNSFVLIVGLSLSSLLLLGIASDFIYPMIGIVRPLSSVILMITFLISTTVLAILCYVFNFSFDLRLPSFDIISPPTFFLLSIGVLNLLGIFLINFHENNSILLLVVLIISTFPILVLKRLPEEYFPLTIFIISISLLYQASLISMNLTGTDIFTDAYFAKYAYTHSYWDHTIKHNYNSVAGTILIPVIFSKICGLNVVWVYKILFSFIFGMVPLALYSIYVNVSEKRIGKKGCFFAVFLVVSSYIFFQVIPRIPKQEIAELFYVLLILLIFIFKRYENNKSFALIVVLFSSSLIFSHYGLAYLILFFSALLMAFQSILRKKSILDLSFLAFFFSLTFGWYIYISGGFTFLMVVTIARDVFVSISELGSSTSSLPLQIYSMESPNILHSVYRYFYYFIIIFLFVGMLGLLKRFKRTDEYDDFSIINFGFLMVFVIVPIISYKFDFYRIFHITSLVLAPFFIEGFKVFFSDAYEFYTKIRRETNHNFEWEKYSALILTFFFLFNSGFVFEIFHDPYPTSIPLSLQSSETYASKESVTFLRVYCPTDGDIKGANWVRDYRISNLTIYSTFFDMRIPSLESSGFLKGSYLPLKPSLKINRGYIYLWYPNVVYEVGFEQGYKELEERVWPMEKISYLKNSDMIYSNGFNEVYLVDR